MSTSAIFCHQTPRVSSIDGSVTLCELADLLVVVDFGRNGCSGRRAALIQAKIAQPNGDIKLKSDGDTNQLKLYLNWPEFRFEKASTYGSGGFDIKLPTVPALAGEGCRYGGIEKEVGRERWIDIAAAKIMRMAGGVPLGEYVTGMAFGIAGRSATPGGSDDWSRLIDLLLNVALKEVYGKVDPIPRSRSSATLMQSFLTSSGLEGRAYQYTNDGYQRSVFYERPPIDLDPDDAERPDGALSTLYISIGEESDLADIW